MFTGIVEEIGTVQSVNWGKISAKIKISANKVLSDVKTGDSINTNGTCLTVTSFESDSFEVDVMAETMRKTNLKDFVPGDRVNLERALKLSDRMGGHIVSGHIDGTGKVISKRKEDNATWLSVSAVENILKYIINKGSVALDGVSLTVANAGMDHFNVSIIPHTASETTLLEKKTGDLINIECDITGKYIEKFMNIKSDNNKSEINYNYLSKHGFID